MYKNMKALMVSWVELTKNAVYIKIILIRSTNFYSQ